MVLTTYSGLPMAMPIVTARYSAITPSAIRMLPEKNDTVRHTGSPSLLRRIEVVAPKLAIFGHIHEGRGEWQHGATRLANVTILDERYQHVHPPWVFELADA